MKFFISFPSHRFDYVIYVIEITRYRLLLSLHIAETLKNLMLVQTSIMARIRHSKLLKNIVLVNVILNYTHTQSLNRF